MLRNQEHHQEDPDGHVQHDVGEGEHDDRHAGLALVVRAARGKPRFQGEDADDAADDDESGGKEEGSEEGGVVD